MNILVTGADGFLGAHLCRYLGQFGHNITGMALNRKGHTSLDALGADIRLEYGDITDRAYVERVINAYEPEWLFHLAAVSIVRVAEQDPARAYQTNIMGTVNVCQAAARCHVPRVIVASTDKAYGDQGTDAPTEDAPLKAKHPYEISKAAADMIARGYGAIVTRCANLYGQGDLNWSRLVPNTCRLVLQGKPPEIHGSAAGAMREWLYVGDAVKAYDLLAQRGTLGEAYNVGSGDLASPAQVAQWLAEIAKVEQPLAESGKSYGEIPYQRVDSGKVRELAWRPHWTLSKALPVILAWYRDYIRWPHMTPAWQYGVHL